MTSGQEPVSRYIRAADGLRLHYLDYPAPPGGAGSALLPVVCLPGLARSADDFDRIARTLQADGRRVLALDYRGRGRSDWDQDWRRYAFDVEQDDIAAQLADAGVEQTVFVGTSRGGLHTMRIAARRPGVVRGAVLNDIGPKIEHAGLLRIKRYVGRLPPIASMREAIALMRMTAGVDFSGVSPQEWEDYARLTFVEKDGKVQLRYDPDLSHTLDAVCRIRSTPWRPMWSRKNIGTTSPRCRMFRFSPSAAPTRIFSRPRSSTKWPGARRALSGPGSKARAMRRCCSISRRLRASRTSCANVHKSRLADRSGQVPKTLTDFFEENLLQHVRF
ncbi:MAG: alpha/beta hydrolase fold protein [Methylocystaceae bacterium]|nr:MAG: alpha/beta hydrolase fold protein [Methylocystaceae bacterium]